MTSYGELLRRARIRKGESLRSAARWLGCSPTHMSDVERGNRGPFGKSTTVVMARYYGTDEHKLCAAARRYILKSWEGR